MISDIFIIYCIYNTSNIYIANLINNITLVYMISMFYMIDRIYGIISIYISNNIFDIFIINNDLLFLVLYWNKKEQSLKQNSNFYVKLSC